MPAWKLPARPVVPTSAKATCGLALALAWGGCADLQMISADQCGNRVVEPELGEDCDGETQCGLPGSAHACRFLCSAQTPCDQPGHGCGTDGVCRRSSGEFSVLGSSTTSTALDVFSDDLNLDGCQEIFLTTRQTVQISAFDSLEPERCHASQQSLPFGQAPEKELSRSAPFLADVTGDGRFDLLRPGDAQFSDSLFVHAAPEGAPILYPTLKAGEEKVRPLKVRFNGNDALLLLLDNPMDMGGVGLAGVLEPQDIPINLGAGLMERLDDMVIVAPAELGPVPLPPGIPGMACAECEEVLLGAAGRSNLLRMSLHIVLDDDGNPSMATSQPMPVITLPGGAVLRDHNAALAFIDQDLDGALDVVVNAQGGKVFIAYGTGDGRFHGSSPPDLIAPDGKASAFIGGPPELSDPDFIFVAGDFDSTKVGLELRPLVCPPADPLESSACGPAGGECEAVVTDIDMDGRPDIVANEHQQPGLLVRRSVGMTGNDYQTSFIDTRCPAHNLATGDFDNDGIDDVAFFDQVPVSPVPGAAPVPVTTLMVAYGNAFAAPNPPAESGRFEQAQGLTAGRFGGGSGAAQLYAARGLDDSELRSGLALVEGYGQRHLFAPFYFPAAPGTMQSFIQVEIPAATGGRFIFNDKTQTHETAVAVMTLDHPEDTPEGTLGSERLWLLQGRQGGSILDAYSQQGAPPIACARCVLVAIDVLPAGDRTKKDGVDELLVLSQNQAVLYSVHVETDAMGAVTSRSFEEVAKLSTTHAFSSVDRATKPDKHAPRPLVGDLDGDGLGDIVLRAEDGSLAVLWSLEDGGFKEGELVPADVCAGKCSAALFDLDGDGPRELVVLFPGGVGAYRVTKARTAEPLTAPGNLKSWQPDVDTDFTAIVAADLDGDGVEDLALMNSSSLITALRALPVRE